GSRELVHASQGATALRLLDQAPCVAVSLEVLVVPLARTALW
ncbi:MAG: hypothetical protein JWN88_836, partial [Frankiales bacterium]|nr:hypothetical protein [Frankiales bacterium]